jgi:four helix bundle protein
MGFMFEKLKVYQRAVTLAEQIFSLCDNYPRGQAALVDQFKRAVLSISANIAEGNGRWHLKERRNFFLIARGSLFECVPLLELCKRRKPISEDSCAILKGEYEVLSKMLSALIKGTVEKRENWKVE